MNTQKTKSKAILVILDGLNLETAEHAMGYLHALCKHTANNANQDESSINRIIPASFHHLTCELPSLSRPLYETLLTGSAPIQSGIVHNAVSRLSTEQSVFSLAKASGLSTGAAAYHWFSELYNRTPYNPFTDRRVNDPTLNIQHGIFYSADHYPDDHLFFDAHSIISDYAPDFMLVHPMNVDDAGHKFGGQTQQYRNAARMVDGILSLVIPQWIELGYQIMITSDHGMNADRSHGGNLPEETAVPLFLIGDAFNHRQAFTLQQTQIAGTLLRLLGVKSDKAVCDEMIRDLDSNS